MQQRRAFTLVELLVVIGIIAVLIGVLLPTLSKAQKRARTTACMSNQRQLVTALIMYCQENKGSFPGGPGYMNVNGVPQYRPGLASWDPVAQNPYSCNQDPNNGPVFLAKYVGNSKKIPACPEEPEIKDTGLDVTNYRTSYWYPMSLVYRPDQVFTPAASINFGTTVQTPQKISAVRHTSQKAVIIDFKTYHDPIVYQVDRKPPWLGPDYKNKRYVVVGFADSHVDYRNVAEMFDADVNYTGRFNPPIAVDPNNAGILGRDFP